MILNSVLLCEEEGASTRGERNGNGEFVTKVLVSKCH